MPARGLLGGTYDPIHVAHLVVAETARADFGLERVVFMPAGNPPHKPERVVAPASDRLRMVELAVAGNPGFAVSSLEIERPGPSYTVDTLGRLLADEPGVEWHLIVGGDTLLEIPTWHEFRRLFLHAGLLVAARPGVELRIPRELEAVQERIRFFYPPALDLSASMIRQRLGRGLSVRYLVPPAVVDYIGEHGLYKRTAGV